MLPHYCWSCVWAVGKKQQCILVPFSDIMPHAKDNTTNSWVLSSSWYHNSVFNRLFHNLLDQLLWVMTYSERSTNPTGMHSLSSFLPYKLSHLVGHLVGNLRFRQHPEKFLSYGNTGRWMIEKENKNLELMSILWKHTVPSLWWKGSI